MASKCHDMAYVLCINNAWVLICLLNLPFVLDRYTLDRNPLSSISIRCVQHRHIAVFVNDLSLS